MEKYDVVALGELLIDFTQNGYSEQGNPIFEANPGGAPCNVLAMLQKLGRKTAFIGKVGRDGFGFQLEKALKEVSIATDNLCFDDVRTTLAVVQKKSDGDRDFFFYRNPGADIMLRPEEIRENLIKMTKIDPLILPYNGPVYPDYPHTLRFHISAYPVIHMFLHQTHKFSQNAASVVASCVRYCSYRCAQDQ